MLLTGRSGAPAVRRRARAARRPLFVNGKWLAQVPSGTQRYATQVLRAVSATPLADRTTLVLPRDAEVPAWAAGMTVRRSRLRGQLFEQLALPWLTRGGHLYCLAGPAPVLKRRQTVVMHDAMPFRHPETFRLAFVLWYRFLYAVLSRTADRLLTVSAFSRSDLARALHVPEARFGLAPCGADHMTPPAPGWEHTLPFPVGSFALLVGNMAPHKNLPATLSALATTGVPIVVVGQAHPHVFRGTPPVGASAVHPLGRVDDDQLAALYAGAAVLVAPSRYEGFGVPIVEAGRLGCPSVFATGSAMPETAGAGGIGFDPERPEQAAALVGELVRDPARRAELSARARANADRFSWADTARTVFGDQLTGAGTRAPARPLRVLHVTETFAAGTGVAVVGFARATRAQGVESSLLAQDRGYRLLDEVADASPFRSARVVDPGIRSLWRSVLPEIDAVRPDLVHVHSSIAGAVVRLRLAGRGLPVVYSPHCFAFERRDLPALHRAALRAVERLLARWTDAFVCVSPHETELARGLAPHVPVRELVNLFGPVAPAPSSAGDAPPLRIVSVGRVAAQKDPVLFARIVRALGSPADVRATWIGGGDDPIACQELEDAGVHVTGWLPAAEVRGRLADSAVYVHTAAWEAAPPIGLLDAMSVGLVVVARRIGAYQGLLPDEWLFDGVPDAVELVSRLRRPEARAARLREQEALLAELATRAPQRVLTAAYRELVPGGGHG
ncbi:glycosyltransferase [Modestobacter sp. NPDC049651]|uniref:glycosyltransferase n=1 Tax=unclassified Modestobacter TaxID=2643866 RepID=UPI0033CBAF05